MKDIKERPLLRLKPDSIFERQFNEIRKTIYDFTKDDPRVLPIIVSDHSKHILHKDAGPTYESTNKAGSFVVSTFFGRQIRVITAPVPETRAELSPVTSNDAISAADILGRMATPNNGPFTFLPEENTRFSGEITSSTGVRVSADKPLDVLYRDGCQDTGIHGHVAPDQKTFIFESNANMYEASQTQAALVDALAYLSQRPAGPDAQSQ